LGRGWGSFGAIGVVHVLTAFVRLGFLGGGFFFGGGAFSGLSLPGGLLVLFFCFMFGCPLVGSLFSCWEACFFSLALVLFSGRHVLVCFI